MRLSKTELQILEQAAKGSRSAKEIASALSKSKSQVYREIKKLAGKGFIARSGDFYFPEKITHVTLLLQLLSQYPNLIPLFSDSGLGFLTATLEQKTIGQIGEAAGLKRTAVFKKLREARQIGLATAENGKYLLNERIWPGVKEFLMELKKYEETIDPRIPASSKIYHKNDKEIVFSSREPVDATLTAFSAYSMYGIKILLPEPIYCLPKRKLTLKEAFLHSLYVADKDRSAKNTAFVALFYVKFRNQVSKIKHPLISIIERVLAGEKIQGCPDLNEIREKGEVYDIAI